MNMNVKMWLSASGFVLLVSMGVLSCKDKTYLEKTKSGTQTIFIKGSDSELPLVTYFAGVCTEFDSDKDIIVEGGGSGTGIEALINGTAQVANASREMNENEYNRAKEKGIDVYPVIFAIDAVAFITHSETGIDSLSLEQIRNIYTGKIRNWKEVSGNDLEIKLYSRNEHSGTQVYVLNKLRINQFNSKVTELESNKNIYEVVKNEKGALGFVSLNAIMNRNGKPVSDIWAINIYIDSLPAVSPYQVERVISGEYVLNRPLYQYFNGKPTGLLKDLVDTELSQSGQALLRRFGYFPLTEYHIRINREKYYGGIQ